MGFIKLSLKAFFFFFDNLSLKILIWFGKLRLCLISGECQGKKTEGK